MTSTNINQGLQEGARSSSRVLQPPGGGSSNIFGADPPKVTTPARARAPPSNNIFGGYDDAPSNAQKHNRLASNIFEEEPAAPGSARKNSKTYESNVFGADAAAANSKPDEENEEEEENKDTAENNNDAKAQSAAIKAKGDSTYNPITGALNIGQDDSPTNYSHAGMGKARGEFNNKMQSSSFSIGAQEDHVPHSARMSQNQRMFSAQRDSGSSGPNQSPTGHQNADVSNPITGESRSFAIGGYGTKFEGAGETVGRPSSRVTQPPGGASTKLW